MGAHEPELVLEDERLDALDRTTKNRWVKLGKLFLHVVQRKTYTNKFASKVCADAAGASPVGLSTHIFIVFLFAFIYYGIVDTGQINISIYHIYTPTEGKPKKRKQWVPWGGYSEGKIAGGGATHTRAPSRDYLMGGRALAKGRGTRDGEGARDGEGRVFPRPNTAETLADQRSAERDNRSRRRSVVRTTLWTHRWGKPPPPAQGGGGSIELYPSVGGYSPLAYTERIKGKTLRG